MPQVIRRDSFILMFVLGIMELVCIIVVCTYEHQHKTLQTLRRGLVLPLIVRRKLACLTQSCSGRRLLGIHRVRLHHPHSPSWRDSGIMTTVTRTPIDGVNLLHRRKAHLYSVSYVISSISSSGVCRLPASLQTESRCIYHITSKRVSISQTATTGRYDKRIIPAVSSRP
jgi:hypothetical protein